ncbi:hypothetical protein DAPPUDRAFT_262128 [Daphnia pulex]|uniref:Uncharacterized protein n=1 Tax=Daphnia pulex TaxID=6669 RepID=E9HME9_DAPPU|nr:hypothetical protein DAPPUDRAFT_262128 [Daphnia pulex]|eukprot:EFX67088.1 hypothetical protein DAPPUDRAFT_262128 [Daphnia pulex]
MIYYRAAVRDQSRETQPADLERVSISRAPVLVPPTANAGPALLFFSRQFDQNRRSNISSPSPPIRRRLLPAIP